jgi:multiple sugar transport system substrate-binding protein
MTYKGKQYGLSYYGDHMSFVCNTDIMQRAGIDKPPATWDEVVQASLKIKQAGIVEYPMLLALAIDTWLIEFVSAMVFSHGGRFVDPQGAPIMAEPGRGAIEAAPWIRDAIHTHKILSPGAIETPTSMRLRAFGAGQHAFYIVPTYRLRALNDPSQATGGGQDPPRPDAARARRPPQARPADGSASTGSRRRQGQRRRARQRGEVHRVLRLARTTPAPTASRSCC